MDLDGLFQEEVQYEIEDITIGNAKFKLKALETQNGQIKSCLSQVKWPAAYPLIAYLNDMHFMNFSTKGTKCIELGSGTGIIGVYLAKFVEFDEVILTDYDEKSIKLISENLAANDILLNEKCSVIQLDWSHTRKDMAKFNKQVDLIVGSDIIYSAESLVPLIETIHYLLKEDSGVCLLANHCIRLNKFEDKLYEYCKKHGLSVIEKGTIDPEKLIKLHEIKHQQSK